MKFMWILSINAKSSLKLTLTLDHRKITVKSHRDGAVFMMLEKPETDSNQ